MSNAPRDVPPTSDERLQAQIDKALRAMARRWIDGDNAGNVESLTDVLRWAFWRGQKHEQGLRSETVRYVEDGPSLAGVMRPEPRPPQNSADAKRSSDEEHVERCKRLYAAGWSRHMDGWVEPGGILKYGIDAKQAERLEAERMKVANVTISMAEETRAMLLELAEHHNLSRSAVIDLAIRELRKKMR